MFPSNLKTARLTWVTIQASTVLNALQRQLRLWWRNSWSRSHLRDLDDHLLRDVGLTRKQAERESLKWFWQ
ncbi:DUF1127 domain-containing protein [Rhizobium sp. NRK18]|uniref:DUF1127 domain-containing protein n=1 Tax=Rhizobium sp. NRK18 TaxID=2964667 RepID=UPI0021C2DABB|nr:DUF1127 domain-containing protein [Rhizobium sp. NRK18]MCQ2004036.1 DUF1127 domain-containing protein [Rhizobium sp. NRK18]